MARQRVPGDGRTLNRVRVLRVIARMNVGGPAQQIVGLQRGLDPARFDALLVTGNVEPGEADHLQLRAGDVPVLRLPELGRSVQLVGDARAFNAVLRVIRDFRPDIVHTHTAKAGVLGRLAARRAGVPRTVHTFHGHLLHGYFPPPVTAAVRATERALARRTDRLLAVGERVRDELLAAGIGDPRRFEVVPPGVEIAQPPPRREARQQLGLPLDGPIVSFVARLTAVKQPLKVAEVCRHVALERPDVRFVVAGDGPLAEELRRAAAGLPITFLGWRPDVERVYAASDLTLLTSANEGMPVSLIEAALCGRAAVTTDVGSAREVVLDGVTGRVVADDRPETSSAAVLDLLADPATLRSMGAAARQRATDQFAMSRLVRDTERIYTDLVEAGA